MQDFTITNFISAMIVKDARGKRIEYHDRYAAAFIIAKKGKIRFSYGSKELILSPESGVFLPKGLHYVNECLEDAESIVINFQTLAPYHEPLQTAPLSYAAAFASYEKIKTLSLSPSVQNRCEIFQILYALAKEILQSAKKESASLNPLVEKALLYINVHYQNADLTVAKIAHACHISEIYLRKLFKRELNTSPYQKVLAVRMSNALVLAREKRSVKEIAARTGYTDVFQFSRAYKRHFGHSPSQT